MVVNHKTQGFQLYIPNTGVLLQKEKCKTQAIIRLLQTYNSPKDQDHILSF